MVLNLFLALDYFKSKKFEICTLRCLVLHLVELFNTFGTPVINKLCGK